jgi:transcriptional regulator with XRE-family HTH domain
MRNERLKAALARSGASVSDLAELCEVDPKTVQRWLSGRVPFPKHRLKLAQRLGVEEDYLWPEARDQAAAAGSAAEIVGAYAHRADVPVQLWRTLLTAARSKIDLVGYALLFFPEQHPNLTQLIAAKGQAGCMTRLAVADPEGQHTRERDELEGLGGTLPDRIRTTLGHFAEAEGAPGFEVRLHEVHLYAGMYRFDDDLIVTPYLVGAHGYQHPALHLRRLGPYGLFERYAGQIDYVWQQSRLLTGEVAVPG